MAVRLAIGTTIIIAVVGCKAPEREATPKFFLVTAQSGLKLRRQASTTSDHLATLPYGTIGRAGMILPNRHTIDGVNGSWINTDYNSRNGWVFSGFVRLADSELELRIEAEKAAPPVSVGRIVKLGSVTFTALQYKRDYELKGCLSLWEGVRIAEPNKAPRELVAQGLRETSLVLPNTIVSYYDRSGCSDRVEEAAVLHILEGGSLKEIAVRTILASLNHPAVCGPVNPDRVELPELSTRYDAPTDTFFHLVKIPQCAERTETVSGWITQEYVIVTGMKTRSPEARTVRELPPTLENVWKRAPEISISK